MNATVDFKQLGFDRDVKARDLWQQKDLGNLGHSYTAKIPGHGVVLLRVSK
jgi:alpha-galactosidase